MAGSVISNRICLVATNQQSSIEYEANVAGITGQSQGQTINADGTLALKTGQSSQVVSSQHHYPSPFSQVGSLSYKPSG